MPEFSLTDHPVDFEAASKPPAGDRYGFARLEVGQTILITPSDDSVQRIRGLIHSHASYYRKKFAMKTHEKTSLYVKRTK